MAQEEQSALPAGVININEDSDDEEAYLGEQKEIAKELEKCKYKSFGKVKKKGKNEERSTVRNLLNRKIELFNGNGVLLN